MVFVEALVRHVLAGELSVEEGVRLDAVVRARVGRLAGDAREVLELVAVAD